MSKVSNQIEKLKTEFKNLYGDLYTYNWATYSIFREPMEVYYTKHKIKFNLVPKDHKRVGRMSKCPLCKKEDRVNIRFR